MTQQLIPNFMRKSHRGKRAARATEIWVDNFAGGGGASTGIELALGRPARIFLENVREFQDWGPVIHQVKEGVKQFHPDGSPKMVPDPARKGETFKRFIGMLRKLGYQVEYRVLNAADYGAPTHRRRFFLIARCDGEAIVWPEPTHGPVKADEPKPLSEAYKKRCERTQRLDGIAKALLDEGRLIVDFETGLVYATESKTPTKPIGSPNRRGYLRTCLTTKGEAVSLMMHRVVWIAKHGVPELGYQINHQDGDKKNNRIKNLELATAAENNEHARCNGLWKPSYGLENGFAKISDAQIADMRASKLAGVSTARIAGRYGISEGYARRVLSGSIRSGVRPTENYREPVRLKPYRTAACCIDWSIPCPSIFTRKKPLAEKTLRRIAMGLKRYVFENPHPFIVNVQHGGEEFRGQDMNRPLGTITQKHGYGVVTPFLAECANSNWSQGHRAADVPAPTVTSSPKGGSWALVSPFISAYHHPKNNESRCADPRNPLNTLDTSNRYAAVAAFLNKYRGDSAGTHPAEPLPTITAGDGAKRPAGAAHALGVTNVFLAGVGGRAGQTPPTAADAPVGTITAKNDRAIVATHLTKFYNTSIGSDVNDPMPTITASAGGGHLGEVRAFLLKYYGKGPAQTCEEPLHTITTKDRFGLVTIHGQDYQIVDIGLRMLTPRELLRAQFSPELAEDYVLPKSNAEAVAKIGNSVCPLAAYALVKANIPAEVAA